MNDSSPTGDKPSRRAATLTGKLTVAYSKEYGIFYFVTGDKGKQSLTRWLEAFDEQYVTITIAA